MGPASKAGDQSNPVLGELVVFCLGEGIELGGPSPTLTGQEDTG